MSDRMPPLDEARMNDAQKAAAAALIAGPRKGVFGPFIPLLRSPELMGRMQRVGEYLRFNSSVAPKLNEFAICIAARHYTNQFEWGIHRANAAKGGVAGAALDAIAEGRHPHGLPADEELVYDFVTEVLRNHGVCDATYARAIAQLGEQGVIDLVGLIGYFASICLVMNVAHSPASKGEVAPLARLPL
jgi:4-carboxymuconolactone decarboxylase